MQRIAATLERARALNTDVEQGLDDQAVRASRAAHGANRVPEVPPKPVWKMFQEALADKTLLILIGAAVLSLGVELLQARLDPAYAPHYIDGIAILLAVLIASLVTTVNEAGAAKQFSELNKIRDDIEVKVLRAGHVKKVSIHDLVVGDVVYFDAGDKLPADGLLLSGADVAIDQSTLTGESVPVDKDAEDPQLKGGTTVTGGSGCMLIEAVGEQSEIGKLQRALTDDEDAPTPLQERLAVLADRIGYFGLGAAILTFAALSISAGVRGEMPVAMTLETARHLLTFLIVAVTIIVVAVPEGLPLAVTISLAYSVKKMARDNNLVRKLASCETMGAATVVCSDKTGTLTKNRMSVVAGHVAGHSFEEAPTKDALGDAAQAFADVAAIDATAFLERDDAGHVTYVGNPTECALLALIETWGFDYRALRDAADVVHQLGFTSDRKRMSTLVKSGEGHRLLVKGAPEVVLERSTRFVAASGTERLDDDQRAARLADVERFSSQGHRTLALAYRDFGGAAPDGADALESDLVLLGVVAIADPVRPEVKEAVAECRRAGVEVKIVTGDNPLTAQSIGTQIGLIEDGDLVMEGAEFRALSDEEVVARLPKLRVLARSVPTDKHRLVSLLKANGEVVAVTGDGTNDAPALKVADVGFSMGITGTEVAKEASDIVLLDDNFASIVGGIQWGRSIFENIRKFLQFQLTVNVVALGTAFLAAVLGFGIPLNTVQLLWVNLIMDTLAALALATEPPTEELFEQPPHGRHAPLITRAMWTSILTMGLVMIGVLVATMWTDWIVPGTTAHAEKLTFVFNAFVMMQLFNEVNARSTRFDRGVLRGFADSPLFVAVLVVTFGLQIVIVQLGGDFFRTVPLSMDLWIRSVVVGASTLVLGFVLRAVLRNAPKAWYGEASPDAT
ncbi:MAG: calcium-translocating P-type ATPase, PMCA-type [Deltaproteobacteria bacterium]|jgi:Ca2+-transporting ATPase